jgi:hypothetical protein
MCAADFGVASNLSWHVLHIMWNMHQEELQFRVDNYFIFFISSLFLDVWALPFNLSNQPLDFFFLFSLYSFGYYLFYLKWFVKLEFCFDLILIKFLPYQF